MSDTKNGMFSKYEPDAIGELLGTGFKRFETTSGLMGLAKISGEALEILAVSASDPGTGQFRRFIAAAKEIYTSVSVLEDWNPIITAALQRYGFRRIQGGWKWTRHHE